MGFGAEESLMIIPLLVFPAVFPTLFVVLFLNATLRQALFLFAAQIVLPLGFANLYFYPEESNYKNNYAEIGVGYDYMVKRKWPFEWCSMHVAENGDFWALD